MLHSCLTEASIISKTVSFEHLEISCRICLLQSSSLSVVMLLCAASCRARPCSSRTYTALKVSTSTPGLVGSSVSVAKVRSRWRTESHRSRMTARGRLKLTGPLRALVKPRRSSLVCLVMATVRISAMRSVCFCAWVTEVVPPHVEWSW